MGKRTARRLSLATILGVSVLLGLNSITVEGAFPDSPMSPPTIDLNRRCLKAEKYFPKSRIESIYGKKVVFTNPGNQETLNKANATSQEMSAKLEELQRQAQQLGLPTVPISKPQNTYSFNGYPESKDWEQCSVFFINPVGDPSKIGQSKVSSPTQAIEASKKNIEEMILAIFIEYKSTDAAQKAFNAQPDLPQNLENTVTKITKDIKVSGLGDEGRYIKYSSASTNPSFGSVQIDSHALIARKGSFVFSVNFFKEADYAKAEELLKQAVGLAGDGSPSTVTEIKTPTTPTPPPQTIPPPPEDKCLLLGSFKVSSYTPKEAYAGRALPLDSFYYENYLENVVEMEIKGECLNRIAFFSSDNMGLDGKEGIYFGMPIVNLEGTIARVKMAISPLAKEGPTTVEITPLKGDQVISKIALKFNINITGTQYLRRKFKDKNAEFYGSWPVVNPEVLEIEKRLIMALADFTSKEPYLSLSIITRIYEKNIWTLQAGVSVCGVSWAAGCANPGDRIIKLGVTPSDFGRVIYHESVHKFHFCLRGEYPSSQCKKTNFDKEWLNTAGGLIPPKACFYLPIKDMGRYFIWKSGSDVPRCGYIRTYGAYDSLFSGRPFYEDVATMAEAFVFRQSLFMAGDAAGGSYENVYTKKSELLKKYDF